MFHLYTALILGAVMCAGAEVAQQPCDNTTGSSADSFPSCALLVTDEYLLRKDVNETALLESCVEELKYVEKFVEKAEEVESRLDAQSKSSLQTIDLHPLAAKNFL